MWLHCWYGGTRCGEASDWRQDIEHSLFAAVAVVVATKFELYFATVDMEVMEEDDGVTSIQQETSSSG